MAFVARNFYSVLETFFRWECSQTEIVELAMAEKIDLVIALPNVRFDDGSACQAEQVVIAAGAWSGRLAQMAGVVLPISPVGLTMSATATVITYESAPVTW